VKKGQSSLEIPNNVDMTMKRRLKSIDIVRGLAALSVLLTHLGNPLAENSFGYQLLDFYHVFFQNVISCNGGLHPGVVVFIVLSGYCVHMPLSRSSGKSPNWAFYSKRRFYRIYPIMMAAMLIGLISILVTNGHTTHILKNFAVNFLLIPGFLPLDAPLGNPILITVVVECLLYIIYPFGYYAVKRYSWRVVLIACFLVQALNISWLLFTNTDPNWVERNVFSFLLYWWIGAFFINLFANIKSKKSFNYKTAFTGYVMYLITSHVLIFKGAHYINSLGLAILTGYVLCVLHKKENASQIDASRPYKRMFIDIFANLGEKSYSLYAVHLPIIAFTSYVLKKINLSGGVYLYIYSVIAVAIFVAIFYYSIERPFHMYAVRSSNNTLERTRNY
jgi:peptidoglycan/LPS O-acetylase OafA/YrhL